MAPLFQTPSESTIVASASSTVPAILAFHSIIKRLADGDDSSEAASSVSAGGNIINQAVATANQLASDVAQLDRRLFLRFMWKMFTTRLKKSHLLQTVFAIVCFQVVAVLSFLGYLRYQHRLRAIGRLEKLVEMDDGENIYDGTGKGEVQRKSRLAAVQRMHRIGLCRGVLPNPQEWWELLNNQRKHGLAVAGDLNDEDQRELMAEILARKLEHRKARLDEAFEKRTKILDKLSQENSEKSKPKASKSEKSNKAGESNKAGRSNKKKKAGRS